MRKRALLTTIVLTTSLGLGALGAGFGALAGPPITCHPVAIGQAKSLPWDSGAFSTKKGYDARGRLVGDVASILKTETEVLVRMETLRRASVYLREESEASRRAMGWEILGRIMAQALEQEAAGKPSALSWFDAGFLVAAYEQAGVDLGFRAGVGDGITGYAFMTRALEIAGQTKDAQVGEIEYAAAILTIPAMRDRSRRGEQKQRDESVYETHVGRAAQAAKPGSLLETNLAAHLATWGRSLEKVRAEAKANEAKNVSARK